MDLPSTFWFKPVMSELYFSNFISTSLVRVKWLVHIGDLQRRCETFIAGGGGMVVIYLILEMEKSPKFNLYTRETNPPAIIVCFRF